MQLLTICQFSVCCLSCCLSLVASHAASDAADHVQYLMPRSHSGLCVRVHVRDFFCSNRYSNNEYCHLEGHMLKQNIKCLHKQAHVHKCVDECMHEQMSKWPNEWLTKPCIMAGIGELSRALLHVRTPGWADDEAQTPEDKPQVQRYRCARVTKYYAPVHQSVSPYSLPICTITHSTR